MSDSFWRKDVHTLLLSFHNVTIDKSINPQSNPRALILTFVPPPPAAAAAFSAFLCGQFALRGLSLSIHHSGSWFSAPSDRYGSWTWAWLTCRSYVEDLHIFFELCSAVFHAFKCPASLWILTLGSLYLAELISVITNDGRNIVVRLGILRLFLWIGANFYQCFLVMFFPFPAREFWEGMTRRLILFSMSLTNEFTPLR